MALSPIAVFAISLIMDFQSCANEQIDVAQISERINRSDFFIIILNFLEIVNLLYFYKNRRINCKKEMQFIYLCATLTQRFYLCQDFLDAYPATSA